MGDDLGFYLDAAGRVRAGEDLYSSAFYVYSPLVAWILSPFTQSSHVLAWWTCTSIVACLVAAAATVAVCWRALRPWQRPTLALIAGVTILLDRGVAMDLAEGQTDTIVLAITAIALLLATLQMPRWAGGALAGAAIIKTWPALFVLWFLRQGAPQRKRAILAWFGTGLGFVLLTMIVSKPGIVERWISRTIAMSDQDFAVWSAWGVGHELLTPRGNFVPLANSPTAATLVDLLLGGIVLGLLGVTLVRPGDPAFALWNVVAASVLLIPVAHQQYHLLLTPLVWLWFARALQGVNPWRSVPVAVLMAFRWAAPMLLDPVPIDDRWKYLAIMLASIATLAASVLVNARSRNVTTSLARGDTRSSLSAAAHKQGHGGPHQASGDASS
ncbi:hypothetical protein KDY119_02793 [Luteimicrobium xylanilyticum]|uniref:DUF2029 domain-containing protein n=2 Tax=Luteimicrobium xylanilyticum TaxID=1133546 RepID=A0A5P9QDE2_9MICO|nr:hypothetical protein KDY119_02793 [Luteimicrobium xylanilyticum]